MLIESVDEALTDMLGHRTVQAVYYYLNQKHSIRPDELPGKIDAFEGICQNLFGSSRESVSKAIAKRLYSKLGWTFWEATTLGLGDHVYRAKTRLAKEPKDREPRSYWLP
jgi:hypothetical protein